MTAICTLCKTEKDEADFVKSKKSKNGLYSWCKSCSYKKKRIWIANNPEKHNSYQSAYDKKHYILNQDKIKQNVKNWAQKNPERVSQLAAKSKQRRKQRLSSVENERLSSKDHKELLSKLGLFDGQYFYCYVTGLKLDKKDLSFDHVVPLSKGGPNKRENLLPMNLKLNLSKQDKLLSEWEFSGKKMSDLVIADLKPTLSV